MSYIPNESDRLDATFAALADPTRRAILMRLAKGDVSVMALAQPFAMSQPAISKHLKVLEQAGLISRSQDGQKRPRKIESSAFALADEWLDKFRKLWEYRYEQLDFLLEEMKKTRPIKRREKYAGKKKSDNNRQKRS